MRKKTDEEKTATEKAYREAHKEEKKAYREAHKEEIKAMRKKYVEEHREEMRVKDKIYRIDLE